MVSNGINRSFILALTGHLNESSQIRTHYDFQTRWYPNMSIACEHGPRQL